MRYPSVSVGAATDFGLLGVLYRGGRRGGELHVMVMLMAMAMLQLLNYM